MTGGSNGTAHGRSQSNTQKLDHYVLRSSIDVSVTGMKQALLALENGNKEVCLTIIYILDIHDIIDKLDTLYGTKGPTGFIDIE